MRARGLGAPARRRSPALTALLAALVLGACAYLLFARLGEGSLGGDEARYAAVVTETRAAGGPLPYRLGGETYVDKPPLGLLLLAGSFDLLGESELAARLPSALFGLAAAALLFVLGTRWIDPLAGAVAALLFVTSPTALSRHGLRGGTFDALLVLLVVAALALWIEGLRGARRARFGGVLALVALATLVKSLIAAALVAVVVGVAEAALSLARAPNAGFARAARRAGLVLATGAGVLALWIAALLGLGVPDALERLIGWDLVARATTGIDPSHVAPAGRYLELARADFGLALLLVLPALAALARAARRGDAALAVLLPLTVWPVAMVALLSCSASKLDWYALPAWAGLALLAGAGAGVVARSPRAPVRALAWIATAALVAPGLLRARELVAARPWVVATDRLTRALEAVPEARLWSAPGLDLAPAARYDPEHPPLLAAADAYYLLRHGGPRVGWPAAATGVECAVLLVARTPSEPIPEPAASWPRYPLSDTPLAALDGCDGRIVDRLRHKRARSPAAPSDARE